MTYFDKCDKEIIKLFRSRKNGELSTLDISREIDVTWNSTHKHLAWLEKRGLFVSNRLVKCTFWKVNPEKYKELVKVVA